MIRASFYITKLPTWAAWWQHDRTGFTIRLGWFGFAVDWPNTAKHHNHPKYQAMSEFLTSGEYFDKVEQILTAKYGVTINDAFANGRQDSILVDAFLNLRSPYELANWRADKDGLLDIRDHGFGVPAAKIAAEQQDAEEWVKKLNPKNHEVKLRRVTAEQLGVNPHQLTEDATWENLGADSLDRVELVMAAEEEFDLAISDEDADKLKTFGEARDYIFRRLKEESF